MLYLITSKGVPNVRLGSPEELVSRLENMVVPSLKMLDELTKGNKLVGGSLAGARGGAIIMNAASNEEVNDLLTGLPFWGLLEWEITPLVSFREQQVIVEKQIKQLKASTKK